MLRDGRLRGQGQGGMWVGPVDDGGANGRWVWSGEVRGVNDGGHVVRPVPPQTPRLVENVKKRNGKVDVLSKFIGVKN